MKELKNLKTLNNKKILVAMPLDRIEDELLSECAYSLAVQSKPIDLLVLSNGLSASDKKKVSAILDDPVIKVRKKKDDGTIDVQEAKAGKGVNHCIENTKTSNFAEIFNEAFNYAIDNGYEWFSIVEYDDVTDGLLFERGMKFSEEKDDVDGFMPITREIANGTFVGFFNEAPWSEGMAEVAGYADLQLLLKFSCLNITGAMFKTESLKEYSEEDEKTGESKPMKESMKISYAYEFFLRMVYEDLKFYTIQRVGYERRIDSGRMEINDFSCKIPRNLSEIPADKGGVPVEEIRWWIDLAKKEYFFQEDRKLEYKPDNKEKEEAPVEG